MIGVSYCKYIRKAVKIKLCDWKLTCLYLNYYHDNKVMNKTISITATVALSFALFFAYAGSATVFAQNQSTSTSSAAAGGNDTASMNQTGQGGTTIQPNRRWTFRFNW